MKTVLKKFCFAAVAIAGAAVVVEGLASLGQALYEALFHRRAVLAEQLHTQYDPELGWINLPGRTFVDLYGPGRTLTTNAQGFRGAEPVAPSVPPGRLRICCAGDSFTLGYGVDDADAWCRILEDELPGVETVNLGMGGYGIDQAYLWYRRACAELAHDVVVLAFIDDDFARLEKSQFAGYGKPKLALEDGRLVVANRPVPRRATWRSWLAAPLPALRQLRSVAMLEGLLRRAAARGEREASAAPLRPAALAWNVFEELAAEARRRGIAAVFVYLPRESDRAGGEALRDELARGMKQRGLDYLDLTPHLAALADWEAAALFIRPGELEFPGAAGHYSPAGNHWAARHLAAGLAELPAVAARREAKAAERDAPPVD